MTDTDLKHLTLNLLLASFGLRQAPLSSWLKQTIILRYKQADQQALDLVQVKAHDIKASAASKAFYGGVSLDQIMQACHWKTHNTFYNFLSTRPDLVRQQQYVPGYTSSSSTGPRSFLSDWSYSEGKKGGAHLLQPSLPKSSTQGYQVYLLRISGKV